MSTINLPLYAWLENVGEAALSSRETIQTSFDIARLALERGIEGDFVECGVFGGAQCAVMARAIMLSDNFSDRQRRVHLFDSFTGIPEAGEHDEEYLAAGHKAGLSACSLGGVKSNMQQWGIPDSLLVWHPGLVEETTTANLPEKIAVLRLDCDLYEPTKVCMENLYPLVSPGGWVIIDDFVLSGARKAVMEYFQGGAPGPVYWRK